MDTAATSARDFLVVKVAAGVVIGGLVLFGLAKYCGIVIIVGSIPSSGSPAQQISRIEESPRPQSVHPAVAPVPKAEHAAPATTAAPAKTATNATASQGAAPTQGAPANAALPQVELPQTAPAAIVPQQPAAQAVTAAPQTPPASTSASKPDSKPQPKLEPVPVGFQCMDGRLFRVLANGFEQITDGSEKRYCPPGPDQ